MLAPLSRKVTRDIFSKSDKKFLGFHTIGPKIYIQDVFLKLDAIEKILITYILYNGLVCCKYYSIIIIIIIYIPTVAKIFKSALRNFQELLNNVDITLIRNIVSTFVSFLVQTMMQKVVHSIRVSSLYLT